MKKKISIAVVLIVAIFAIGGLWVYQATVFEKYMTKQLETLQESLKERGLYLTYDNLWISRVFLQMHLVNPKLTGTPPQNAEDVKSNEALYLQGEIVASYAPLKNAVNVEVMGESHYTSGNQMQFDVSTSPPVKYLVTIQRKEYDFFGKNPFLSFDNIRNVSFDIKGISTFVNGQKFTTLDNGYVDVSFDYKEKAMDLAVRLDINQIQFYAIEKFLIGEPELVDPINAKFRQDMLMHENLGPQDQIISFAVHLKDYAAYWEHLKSIFNKEYKGDSKDTFEKLFPEETQYLVKEFSTKNKIVQALLKGSFVRIDDKVPIQIEVALKVSDQWENFWNDFYKQIYQNIENVNPDEAKRVSFQEFETAVRAVMPQLHSFGQTQMALNVEVPILENISEKKKMDFNFESDLYDIGFTADVNKETSSYKITTRNAPSLMKDLNNYVDRASVPFEQLHPNEVQSVKVYVKMGQVIASKFLEPQDVAEQSLDIQVQQGNVKIGKYDLPEFMAILGEAMVNQVSEQ